MLLDVLETKKLISPPKWMTPNTHFLTAMGSVAYGCSADMSDIDVYGFCFPPRQMLFPHLSGYIPGFGTKPQGFETWQDHHVIDKETGKEYDFQVHSIVKYFHLCMENNPQFLDSLFVPQRCILHETAVAQLVRENRKLFLSRKVYPTFRGYAYGQIKKLREKKTSDNPKRQAAIDSCGFDSKAGYHIVRLSLQCEQILTEGDLDLERNSEILKAIRRGEWTLDRLEQWFADKERHLENAKDQSELPHSPDEERLKDLLLKCLEHHYGNLEKAVVRQTDVERVIREMQEVIDRYA